MSNTTLIESLLPWHGASWGFIWRK